MAKLNGELVIIKSGNANNAFIYCSKCGKHFKVNNSLYVFEVGSVHLPFCYSCGEQCAKEIREK